MIDPWGIQWRGLLYQKEANLLFLDTRILFYHLWSFQKKRNEERIEPTNNQFIPYPLDGSIGSFSLSLSLFVFLCSSDFESN